MNHSRGPPARAFLPQSHTPPQGGRSEAINLSRFVTINLALVLGILPTAAPAATVEIFSQEVRVQSTSPGAALIITDFWDKPVEFAFGRLRGERWTYLVKYKSIFRVQARDLTGEQLRALEVEARLRQLEEQIDAVRAQVRLLCEQLDWRGPGCP